MSGDEKGSRRGLDVEAHGLIWEGLHLCHYGERAPGGDETWLEWGRKAEQWVRRDMCERRGEHDGGCPACVGSA